MTPKVALPDSHRKPFNAHATHPVDPTECITVTVALTQGKTFADVPSLIKLATDLKIKWGVSKIGNQSIIHLTGETKALEQVFNVQLKCAQAPVEQGGPAKAYRVREGQVHVPEAEVHAITAVLGLDSRPAARPYFHTIAPHSSEHAYSVQQIASYYQLPIAHAKQGLGQRIGIVEFGGGYNIQDLGIFFQALKIDMPRIISRSVLGAVNSYSGDPYSADGEVMLDIEVIGAVAPAATIYVYFAPNTEQGFLEAMLAAQKDDLTSLSVSWGGPEDSWSRQAIDAISTAIQELTQKGTTVTVATGDSGSNDGEDHPVIDFPSSSPFSLACGGTSLLQNSDGTYVENVWGNTSGGTGGGVSQVFPMPTWQLASEVQAATNQNTMRATPDVSAVADPETGYRTYMMGQWGVTGGTSAAAPLWAAFAALIAQMKGKNLGFINQLLYGLKQEEAFYIISSGSNGFYQGRNGWSACTGLGSPKGVPVAHQLRS